LTLLFFVNAYTQALPMLAIIGLVLMVGVPVLVFRMLAVSFRSTDCKATFSELWLEGISTFFFGTLIVSFVAVVFMMWLQPDWLVGQMSAAIEQGKASGMPQLEEMADILQRALDQHLLPTPIQLVLDMGWMILFSGSLLSMVLSAIVRATKK
jgi:hypothetical protein